MTRSLPLLLLAAAGALACGGGTAQHAPTTVAPAATPGALRPGDLVRLRIWREPDLSGDFAVDEQGKVVFPKLGPIEVVGMAPDSLKARLVDSYSVYLRNPAIDVMLLRRITILGGVRNAGLYPVDPTMTLADAYALAGGISPDGKPDQIELVRDGQRTTFKVSGQTRIGDTPLRSGDQLYVPTRGWLARNTWLITAGIGTTASILLAVLR
jgi:protein involved in polysaccharide export with SLBB domain